MKKVLLVAFVSIFTSGTFAQTHISTLDTKATTTIVLKQDQLLKFITTVKGNVSQESLGTSVDMNLDMKTDKNILVKKADKEKYQIDLTTTRLKMNFTMMGKATQFDSDNKDDMNGEMKDAGKDINVVKKLELSSNNYCHSLDTTSKAATKSSDDIMGNMLQQMMGSANDEATVETYFMLLPLDKKVGDSWSDSIITTDNKKYITYTWDSTTNNLAKISIKQKMINTIKTEMMGMDISSNITNDIIEERRIDLKTSVVISRKSTSKMSGTAEVLGMSMPINGTIITEVTSE